MKVNVISESQYIKEKFGGIHTAFINHVVLLQKKGIKVVINSSKKADIVHIHSYGPFALYKLLTCKEPKVVSTHVVPASLVGSYKGGKILQKLITKYLIFFYNKANLVLAVNPKTKEDLKKLGVISRIEVLSNHINSDLFNKDDKLRKKGREIYKFYENDFIIISAGRQSPRKGICDFVTAARRLPSFKFVWAGGRETFLLSAQTEKDREILRNPPQNILFVGTVSYQTMPILFNMADILFFPSHQETQGLVIIEAAACGLPVVLRDLPEYKRVYGEGYIACRYVDKFCDAMQKLYTDKKFYQLRVEESKLLAAKFSDVIIGDKMIAYYQSLL